MQFWETKPVTVTHSGNCFRVWQTQPVTFEDQKGLELSETKKDSVELVSENAKKDQNGPKGAFTGKLKRNVSMDIDMYPHMSESFYVCMSHVTYQ